MIVKGIPAVRFNGPCWKLGPQVVTSLKYTLLIREWLSKHFLLLEISPRCCIGTVRPQKAICCPLFHVILSVCIKTISCFGLRSSAESNPHERERQRRAYKCIFIEVQYSHLASKLHLCKLQTLYTYFIHFILFYFFKDVSKPPEGVHGFESRSLLLEDPLTAVDGHGSVRRGGNGRYSCPTDIYLSPMAGWLKSVLFHVYGTFHGGSLSQHAGLLTLPDVVMTLFHRLILLVHLVSTFVYCSRHLECLIHT